MRAQHRSSVPGWLRLLLSLVALGLSVPAMVSSFTSAGLVAVASATRGAAAHAPAKSAKPMFGALGKFITTAAEAKPWAPNGRQAYRVDIPIMSSTNPDPLPNGLSSSGGAGRDEGGVCDQPRRRRGRALSGPRINRLLGYLVRVFEHRPASHVGQSFGA